MKWQGNWDPEGILSTLPSIATGISGMLAGHLFLSKMTQERKVIYMFSFGFFAFATGYMWNYVFPINKNIWTSSYVMVTSGLAAMVLAISIFLSLIHIFTATGVSYRVELRMGSEPSTV